MHVNDLHYIFLSKIFYLRKSILRGNMKLSNGKIFKLLLTQTNFEYIFLNGF